MRAMIMTNWSMIEPPLHRRDDSCGHPDEEGKEEGCYCQENGGRQSFGQGDGYRAPHEEGISQITPEDLGYPAVELDMQRLVEAQVFSKFCYFLGVASVPSITAAGSPGMIWMRRKEITATRLRTGIKLKTRRMMYAPTLLLPLSSHFGGRSFDRPPVVLIYPARRC